VHFEARAVFLDLGSQLGWGAAKSHDVEGVAVAKPGWVGLHKLEGGPYCIGHVHHG